MVDTDQEAILLYRIRIMLSQQGLLDAFERLTENRITKKIERTKYHFHWQDVTISLSGVGIMRLIILNSTHFRIMFMWDRTCAK